jgi:hypothetical protein
MKKFGKHIIVAVVFVLCLSVLAACSNSANVPTENSTVENTTSQSVTTENLATESSTETSDAVKEEGTIKKDGNVILKQLAFVYNDHAIAIADLVDTMKLESMLGKADEIVTHTYSEGDGKNMDTLLGMTENQYFYPGLVIKTIDATVDKTSFIFSIEITDPKYPTIRNIKVGDSYEKLKEAYPEGNLLGGELSDQEDTYRYEPVNYVDAMNFQIKDKKVESIMIFTLLD